MEASQAERRSFLDLSRLYPAEYLGFAAAGVLLLSLFLPWFTATGNGQINGQSGTFDAFGTFVYLDWLLVAACSAPFILAYIIARGHDLAWRPGEITMIAGITAFVLIFCNGIVFGKPGDPGSEISFDFGYLVGLIGAAGIGISGFLRQAEGAVPKPPGV